MAKKRKIPKVEDPFKPKPVADPFADDKPSKPKTPKTPGLADKAWDLLRELPAVKAAGTAWDYAGEIRHQAARFRQVAEDYAHQPAIEIVRFEGENSTAKSISKIDIANLDDDGLTPNLVIGKVINGKKYIYNEGVPYNDYENLPADIENFNSLKFTEKNDTETEDGRYLKKNGLIYDQEENQIYTLEGHLIFDPKKRSDLEYEVDFLLFDQNNYKIDKKGNLYLPASLTPENSSDKFFVKVYDPKLAGKTSTQVTLSSYNSEEFQQEIFTGDSTAVTLYAAPDGPPGTFISAPLLLVPNRTLDRHSINGAKDNTRKDTTLYANVGGEILVAYKSNTSGEVYETKASVPVKKELEFEIVIYTNEKGAPFAIPIDAEMMIRSLKETYASAGYKINVSGPVIREKPENIKAGDLAIHAKGNPSDPNKIYLVFAGDEFKDQYFIKKENASPTQATNTLFVSPDSSSRKVGTLVFNVLASHMPGDRLENYKKMGIKNAHHHHSPTNLYFGAETNPNNPSPIDEPLYFSQKQIDELTTKSTLLKNPTQKMVVPQPPQATSSPSP